MDRTIFFCGSFLRLYSNGLWLNRCILGPVSLMVDVSLLFMTQSVESLHWYPCSKHETLCVILFSDALHSLCFFSFLRFGFSEYSPFWMIANVVLPTQICSKITPPWFLLLPMGRWEFPTRVFSLLWTHIRRASGRSLAIFFSQVTALWVFMVYTPWN